MPGKVVLRSLESCLEAWTWWRASFSSASSVHLCLRFIVHCHCLRGDEAIAEAWTCSGQPSEGFEGLVRVAECRCRCWYAIVLGLAMQVRVRLS